MMKLKRIHKKPYGNHMTIDEFVNSVLCYLFTNNDGCGTYATETHESNVYVNPDVLSIEKEAEQAKKAGFTHVIWYNK